MVSDSNFFSRVLEIFHQGLQKCIPRILRNDFRKKIICTFSVHSGKNFVLFVRNVSSGLQEGFLKVDNTIWRNFFKNIFFVSFWNTERKSFGLLSKIFRRGYQNWFLYAPGDVFGILVSLEIKNCLFHHFLILSVNVSNFVLKISEDDVKTAFYVCRGSCRRQINCFE